ncbi:MAG: HPF/RaiA family ribosome-associated protein [Anaerolineae bacterium]
MPEPSTDLDFEFYGEDLPTAEAKEDLRAESWKRVQELATGHSDLIGASVAVERVEHHETPQAFRARIVGYMAPKDVVTKEKATKPMAALQQALDALERQVREEREKRRQPWEKP